MLHMTLTECTRVREPVKIEARNKNYSIPFYACTLVTRDTAYGEYSESSHQKRKE